MGKTLSLKRSAIDVLEDETDNHPKKADLFCFLQKEKTRFHVFQILRSIKIFKHVDEKWI